ncbi:MAG TPA: cyclic nucleotide-binding domain-containing protein [Thermoanaerobaculia bacterium]
MQAEKDYREIFRRAGARWLEGDASAISDFEKGITVALDEGDMAAALSAHQRLLVWKPGDKDLHRRVAQAIAAARDRPPKPSETETALAHSSLFSGLSRDELTTLLTVVAPLKVSAGSAVVREGEPGDSLFLVASGMLRVSTRADDGSDVVLADLGPGDFFGEVALLTRRPRTATVKAITEAELLRLDAATVERLRQTHKDIDASLAEFHRRRAEKTVEALIEKMKRSAG